MHKIVSVGLILALLEGCTLKSEPVATYKEVDENGNIVSSSLSTPSNVAQFSDIPIPEGALMNTESSVIMGSGDSWIGRLIYSSPYAANAVFEYYLTEMPRFGWTEVTVVRGGVNQMIYQQGIRIANIQITSTGNSSSEILFMVSPPSKTSATNNPNISVPKTTIKSKR